MTISHTIRTVPFSTHSSSRTALLHCPSPTRRRPRRSSRRCQSERSTRARRPQRPRSPQHEGKVLHQLQMVKVPAGPSSAACCIARTLRRVRHHHQLLRPHYPSHHLPRNLRVLRRPRQIYPLTSMTRRRKDCWMSFCRWALQKIKLQRIPSSSKAGLPESSKLLLLRLQLLLEGHLLHLLPLHPKRTPSALRELVPVQAVDAGLRLHHRHGKLARRRQRSRSHLHRVNRHHQLDDLLHLHRSQMLASSQSRRAQHTLDGRERHQAQLRVHLRLHDHRRRRWMITNLVHTDSECLRRSQAIARFRHRLRLPVAALLRLALHPRLLEQ